MQNSSSSSFLTPGHCVVPVKWLDQILRLAYATPRVDPLVAAALRQVEREAHDSTPAAVKELIEDLAPEREPPATIPQAFVPTGYRPGGRLKPKSEAESIVASKKE